MRKIYRQALFSCLPKDFMNGEILQNGISDTIVIEIELLCFLQLRAQIATEAIQFEDDVILSSKRLCVYTLHNQISVMSCNVSAMSVSI